MNITKCVSKPDQISTIGSPKNKATVTANKSKLKVSKLKKKSQKVTIKVAGSNGKLKIKNTSFRKLRKYTEEKIGKKKITLTFKKGAPKGTYTFKVNIGASKKMKKSSQIIEIVVE